MCRYWMPLLLLITLLSCGTVLQAQEQLAYYHAYTISYPETAFNYFYKPFQWNGKEWVEFAALMGVGAGLYFVDEPINRFVQDNRNGATKVISAVGTQFGEVKYVLPVMGTLLAAGYVTKSDNLKDTALLCTKSFTLASGGSTFIKTISGRYRPYRDEGNSFWNGSGLSFDRESFPSGHSTIAWSILPIVAHQYSDIKWVPPVCYTLAACTSAARVIDQKHWTSDVYYGALIGFFTSQLVLKTTPRYYVGACTAAPGVEVGVHF